MQLLPDPVSVWIPAKSEWMKGTIGRSAESDFLGAAYRAIEAFHADSLQQTSFVVHRSGASKKQKDDPEATEPRDHP
jgi:hypothetical protein